jgi:hypothetical protein
MVIEQVPSIFVNSPMCDASSMMMSKPSGATLFATRETGV